MSPTRKITRLEKLAAKHITWAPDRNRRARPGTVRFWDSHWVYAYAPAPEDYQPPVVVLNGNFRRVDTLPGL